MFARFAVAVLLVDVLSMPARAQQAAPDRPQLSASGERIRAALQPHAVIGDSWNLLAPAQPNDVHLGALTFIHPDMAGQFVAVRVPIGDIVTHAAHSVAVVQHRRAERAAQQEVEQALSEFKKASGPERAR